MSLVSDKFHRRGNYNGGLLRRMQQRMCCGTPNLVPPEERSEQSHRSGDRRHTIGRFRRSALSAGVPDGICADVRMPAGEAAAISLPSKQEKYVKLGTSPQHPPSRQFVRIIGFVICCISTFASHYGIASCFCYTFLKTSTSDHLVACLYVKCASSASLSTLSQARNSTGSCGFKRAKGSGAGLMPLLI